MPEVRFLWFGWTDPCLIPQEVREAMACAPENVRFPGFVDRERLREAYCGADLFAFMSYEETEGIGGAGGAGLRHPHCSTGYSCL